jgi:hypothetical protein
LLLVAVAACATLAIPAAVAGTESAGAAATTTLSFGSGTDWIAAGFSNGKPVLGHAQLVCMNSSSPPACPAGATNLDSPFGGWSADRSSIPGAEWTWAPGTSGATEGAQLASFVFAKVLVLPGRPTAGSLSLAADDYAEAWVNGHRVGSVGSVTDPALAGAHNYLTTFEITGRLRKGLNLIAIKATNGAAFFSPICSETCTYAQNPAGVLFGVSVTLG